MHHRTETNGDRGGPRRLEELWRPVEVHDINKVRRAETNGDREGPRGLYRETGETSKIAQLGQREQIQLYLKN